MKPCAAPILQELDDISLILLQLVVLCPCVLLGVVQLLAPCSRTLQLDLQCLGK